MLKCVFSLQLAIENPIKHEGFLARVKIFGECKCYRCGMYVLRYVSDESTLPVNCNIKRPLERQRVYFWMPAQPLLPKEAEKKPNKQEKTQNNTSWAESQINAAFLKSSESVKAWTHTRIYTHMFDIWYHTWITHTAESDYVKVIHLKCQYLRLTT